MDHSSHERFTDLHIKPDFSGSGLVMRQDDILFEFQQGYANRAEQIEHRTSTRFGIASGCKLFTAIAVCQLVEQGKLAFTSTLRKYLTIGFPTFDPTVTVEQLLTHTSGIPNYFDESVMDDFEELWRQRPMYHIRQLRDFLPMFQHEPMRQAGGAFQYNNAGYIVLGLIVEQASGLTFTDYIERFVFKPADMSDSGYFSLDALPTNTAFGYIDSADGTWRTNHYSIPVKGGARYGQTLENPARSSPAWGGDDITALHALRASERNRRTLWIRPLDSTGCESTRV